MTEPSKQSGSDPVGDLQRWLIRSSARSVTRQLGGQIRTALGGGKQSAADVWETATTERDQSPECPWCPHCRARRLMRESGPGLGSGVAAAADAVGVVMQDAMSAFEAAVAASARPAQPRDATTQSRDAAPQPAGEVWDEATDEPAVQTRPPANGSATRQPPAQPKQPPAAPKQPPAEAKQPSAAPKRPSAEAKQPPAEAKEPSAGSKQPSAQAKRTSSTAKKPAAPKKPAAHSGDSAPDRTPPDGPTAAKPDEPTD